MEKTITELFKEKNNKILLDKLLLDIANNDDSLRLTITNKVNLITSRIKSKINSLLNESNIEYDVKELVELFDQYSKEVEKVAINFLDIRKQTLSESVSLENRTSKQLLTETIEGLMTIFDDEVETKLDSVIHEDIRSDILKKYMFKEESQKDDLIMTLQRYDSDLTKQIKDTILDKNSSLLNIFQETTDKVSELDDKAIYLSNKPGEKIKSLNS